MEMMRNRVWSGWWVFQDKNFISVILVRLEGCNLHFSAALIVIQAGMCEACITDLYFATLNRTLVFPFILINSLICWWKWMNCFFFQSEVLSLCAIYYVQTLSSCNGPFSWWLNCTQAMRMPNCLTAVYFT